jgi:L-alanine-DL-glutamate epimerase-like enolase superfamily enzyme
VEITAVDVVHCVQRQADPDWKFALGTTSICEGWIVAITAENGVTGYGYTKSAAHIGSNSEIVKAGIDGMLPRLIGKDSMSISLIMQDLDRALVGNPRTKAGVDCALLDLAAKLQGVPLHALFGGKMRDAVPQMRIVPIKSPEASAERAAAIVAEGYRYLKIKVGGDVADDLARLKAIRSRVGPDVHLIVDANQSYTPKKAISALRRMEELGVELCEQPVRADDLKGLELVTNSVDMVVEADESARSMHDVMMLASNRIVDAVSLKVLKLGGLANLFVAARICEVAGIGLRIGAAFGPQLHAAQALHLAAALPGLCYACELSEFGGLYDDPFDGLEMRDGALVVPDTPGSGVTYQGAKKPVRASMVRA